MIIIDHTRPDPLPIALVDLAPLDGEGDGPIDGEEPFEDMEDDDDDLAAEENEPDEEEQPDREMTGETA